MSKLQSAGDYQREIAAVEELIRYEESVAAAHGMDFATELSLETLRTRRSALEDEMRAIGDEGMRGYELDVILEGKPVERHAIDSTFLAAILLDFQRLVRSILDSSTGRVGRMGPIPEIIKQRSALRFAGSFAGSFGMRLEAAEPELALRDAGSLASTFDALVTLLNSGDHDSLLDSLADLNARARSSYRGLLARLSSSGADMRVVWSTTGGARQALVRARAASRLVEKLDHVIEVEQLRSFDGVLDGAIKSRGIFEFQTDDGETISGRVSPELWQALREFFDRPCRALMTIREVTDTATGDTKVHYRLEGLAWPGEGFSLES